MFDVDPAFDDGKLAEQAARLRRSLARQEQMRRSQLILNPVENLPFRDDIAVAASLIHGLYNSDKVRSAEQRLLADTLWAGRDDIASDCRTMYDLWAEALGAADATLRLRGGLNAHQVLLMSLKFAGMSVLLLPVRAGGHVSGQDIVDAIDLETIEMVVDDEAMCVDIPATLERCDRPPDLTIVDRSEGLVLEDLSQLASIASTSVFDASQCLTQILFGDHPHPFDAGYDLLLSTVHKNFPGPQKALIATRERTDTWEGLVKGISTFVSNMDVAAIYAATFTLARTAWLRTYSARMLRCATSLEAELADRGVPVVRRRADATPTHHLWVQEGTREAAGGIMMALEACGFLVNYRTLPYSLGPGLRMGLSAAVRTGLDEGDIPELADLIATIRRAAPSPPEALRCEAERFIRGIWERFEP